MDVVSVLKEARDDSVTRMSAPTWRVRRGPLERLAAWLHTGPLGHLYSVAADVTEYFLRWIVRRAKRRL